MTDTDTPGAGPPDDRITATEAALRRALAARADAVEPKETNVSNLEARADDARRAGSRRRAFLVAAALVVVAGVAGTIVLSGDDDEDIGVVAPSTTTTEAPSTTTSSSTSTTSTSVTEDDGVPGWPGATARMFDDPQAAALNFAIDVLGFADATVAEGETEAGEGAFIVTARPTAGIRTEIIVHDTGPIRGWVVTGAASDEGTIDEVSVGESKITIAGSASAFEATVTVLVLDQEGTVLAQSTTFAGANGEQGPYETTIDVAADAGTPFWVVIAESDASGEGDYTWATTATLRAA